MIESTNTSAFLFGEHKPSEPRYEDFSTTSFYIPMRDGVKIAIDLSIPTPLPKNEKIPALIIQTRYWRNFKFRIPFCWYLNPEKMGPKEKNQNHFFTSHGYALLKVDVRGTGASFGVFRYPWSEESIEDAREIVNWVIKQSWSNGKVGGFGTSFGGTTAELLAVLEHEAVKVVIPKFNHPDPFMDISHPGGLFNQRFIKDWHDLDEALDKNVPPKFFDLKTRILTKGVKPVDADIKTRQLKQAVIEHGKNGDIYQIASQTDFRDSTYVEEKFSMQDISVHRWKDHLNRSSTKIFGWASWFDAGTADAVLRRFLTFDIAGQAVIGAWNHGGQYNASPFLSPETPVSPPFINQLDEMAVIFDHYLKEDQQPNPLTKLLHYYTIGEEKWHTTSVWPPEGMRNTELLFSQQKTLSESPEHSLSGSDTFEVNFNANSGVLNRWWEMNIFQKKSVVYPDFADQESQMLSYTSRVFENDLEISGYPVIHLQMKSSTPDAAIIVYLLDIDENGRVTYLSEGNFRITHRKISNQDGPYQIQMPNHSFLKKDACPLGKDETAVVTFGLLPISALVKKGHRIRVSIAGHDKGTFAAIAEKDLPVFEIFFGENSSKIILPAKWRVE